METQLAINTFVKETGGYAAAQLEACTRCGMCAEACHFYQTTGNPEYAPVWKIELLKRAYEQRFTLAGRAKLALGIDKPINDEDLVHFSKIVYEACTMCNKCSMVCPMGIQLGPLIHEVRTGFSKAGVVPADLRTAVNKQVTEGSPERTKLFIQRIFDAAKELGVKKIVVTECGHAYDALRWTSYNIMEVPAGLEITHIVGLIGEYVRTGKIKLKEGAYNDGTLTFHDACKIQRRGGHIKEPREILNILAPKTFKEMTPNKEEAICCGGGGGGVIAIKEADPIRYAVFELKIDQMRKVGAKTVVMSCSNCRLQFVDCVQHFNLDVKVAGLSQIVAEALVE
jgi:Fe-S oxidoreductase